MLSQAPKSVSSSLELNSCHSILVLTIVVAAETTSRRNIESSRSSSIHYLVPRTANALAPAISMCADPEALSV